MLRGLFGSATPASVRGSVVLPEQYWCVPDEAVPCLRHCARVMVAVNDRDGAVRRDDHLCAPEQLPESTDDPYHPLKRAEKRHVTPRPAREHHHPRVSVRGKPTVVQVILVVCEEDPVILSGE